MALTYRQPDGTPFAVQLWGDEWYADEETTDGWRIVRDPHTKTWCYARLADDMLSFESTGVIVGTGDPAALGLVKHLRIDRGERQRLADLKRQLLHRDRRGRILHPSANGLVAQTAGLPSRIVPTTGLRRGLTLLVRFPDRPEEVVVSQAQVDAFCNQESDYIEFGNNGSVRQFFNDVSGGLLTYTNYVTAYYTARHPRGYYTNPQISYGTRAQDLVKEALSALEENDFDFRSVDANNDKIIDAINCFYAGGIGDYSEGLWPHASAVGWSSAATGVGTNSYQITNIGNFLTLGTFCHEIGHMLCGFPDLYDYDYDSIGGASDFCLMASGGLNHEKNPIPPCAYLRYKAGWSTATTFTSATNAHLRLTAQNGNLLLNQFMLYPNPQSNTEYYLLENRWKNGRDKGLDSGGIAIWHVDELGYNDYQNYKHQKQHYNYECALIQADNQRLFERSEYSEVRIETSNSLYYSGNTAATYTGIFSDNSDASIFDNNAHWWDGSNSGLRISTFSAQGNKMTMMVGTGAVEVRTPNGDQSFNGGRLTSVTWAAYGTVRNVAIDLSTNGGGTWTNLVSGTANDGSEMVTLPNVSSSTCLIRVRQVSGPIMSDSSDAFFTINAAVQEMDVNRNRTMIVDGATDRVGTGVSVVAVVTNLTYTVVNPGGRVLTITGPVALSGARNCTASVVVPPSRSIPSRGSSTFTVRVSPSATGAWSVDVAIVNDDANENPYNWTISGTAVAQPVAVLKRGSTTILNGGHDNGVVSITGAAQNLYYRLDNEAVTGSQSLILSGSPIVITSPVNCTARVTSPPTSGALPGTNIPFIVQVTPSSKGKWGFGASVVTNDVNHSPYTWKISGVAVDSLLQFGSTAFTKVEGSGAISTATITVSRIGSGHGAVAVNYTTRDGTATAGRDYMATSGTLRWADGDTAAKVFTIGIVSDIVMEANETVYLTLTSPQGDALLGRASIVTLTIINDDFIAPALAIDYPGMVTNGGDRAWRGIKSPAHDGIDAAQSGVITDNQTSDMSIKVSGPATVTWWWKVSSEENYDYLRFLDNGVELESISGKVDWTPMSVDLTPGIHILTWSYSKEEMSSLGDDAGYIDQVVCVPTPSRGIAQRYGDSIFQFLEGSFAYDLGHAHRFSDFIVMRTDGCEGELSVTYGTKDGAARVPRR
jgi:M6 family metalloprotease-like protein